MKYLNLILFGGGFFITTIGGIILLVKFATAKKIGLFVPLLLVLGIASVVTGLILPAPQKSSSSNAISNANPEAQTEETTSIDATKTSPKELNLIQVKPYDPSGSVVPKKSNSVNDEIIVDADGSKAASNKLLFTPEGIRYYYDPLTLESIVEVPDGKNYPDGKHYKSYSYSIDGMNGYIYVSESNFAIPEEYNTNLAKDLGGGKSEIYKPNSGYEMKKLDFIYKYIPVSSPKNPVKNDFLNSSYYGKADYILGTKTTLSLEIIDENILEFKNSYISGIDGLYGYKLESLGKNAYKLYLYPAFVKADTNSGGGVSIGEDPLKNTFILYRTGLDSFDIVFTSDKIERTSISMGRA